MLVGAHVGRSDPLAAARERGADCVQMFLSDPQSWKPPPPRDDADALRSADLPIFVHAPYLVNLASPNPKIRIPSRKILRECCEGAEAIGASGVVVHGGHVTADDDVEAGFERWVKALEQLECEVPVLLENTAGGDHALARHFDTLARLWDRIGGLGIGFCLDTCHAHAAGEGLEDLAGRALAVTGRIDLVHCNDSKDPAGCGRDRHENIGPGTIGLEALAEVVKAAGAPVIFETPGDGQAADIALLREAVSA